MILIEKILGYIKNFIKSHIVDDDPMDYDDKYSNILKQLHEEEKNKHGRNVQKGNRKTK